MSVTASQTSYTDHQFENWMDDVYHGCANDRTPVFFATDEKIIKVTRDGSSSSCLEE